MRHHKRNRVFGRERNQRKALLRGLAVSLIERGRIKTTEAKAKEIRPFVEKLLTVAKSGTLSARRLVVARLASPEAAMKLCDSLAPKFKERQGGYLRIIKTRNKRQDAALTAIIEFVA